MITEKVTLTEYDVHLEFFYDRITLNRLRKHLDLLKLLTLTVNLSKKYEKEFKEYIVYDVTHNNLFNIWFIDERRKSVRRLHGRRGYSYGATRMIAASHYASVLNGWFREPVDIDEFKDVVSKIYPPVTRNLNRRFIGSYLERSWARELFSINKKEDTVKTRYLPMDIWTEKIEKRVE
jgi:hypothetical protein